MLKILEKPDELQLETKFAPNLAPNEPQKPSRAQTRAAIDAAILANPNRSDADIAREIGCDAKTVKSRRGNSRSGNSEAGNSRHDHPTEPDPARDASNDDDPDPHTLAGQQKIEMYFNNEGALVLKQHNWPDEDSVIIVAEPYTGLFLDKLCDVLGIPNTKDLLR
jgi:hypothetical protein